MSIVLQGMFNDACSDLGTGVGDSRMADAFVRAVNHALDELSICADEATKLAHVEETTDTVDDVDEHLGYILYAGIMYYLIRSGMRPSDPKIASIVYADTERRWKEAKADYRQEEDNQLQDDEDEDVIGLGSLT